MKYIITTPNYSTIERIIKLGFLNLTLEVDIIYFQCVLELTEQQLEAIIYPENDHHYDLDLIIRKHADKSIVFIA